MEVVAPAPLGFEDVAAVHERSYVNAVMTGEPRVLAEAQGFARGSSFCTFNGLVIAARAVLSDGLNSLLVLDLDAHCGGGTHSLIADDSRIRQVDVSVCPIDEYRPTGENVRDTAMNAGKYLGVIERRLNEIDRSGWMPGLCLYNAGMDPVETCSIGGMAGISEAMMREREAIVFEWLGHRGIPVAFVLAGGYSTGRLTRDGLVALHRFTIEEAARRAPGPPPSRLSDVPYIMSVPG